MKKILIFGGTFVLAVLSIFTVFFGAVNFARTQVRTVSITDSLETSFKIAATEGNEPGDLYQGQIKLGDGSTVKKLEGSNILVAEDSQGNISPVMNTSSNQANICYYDPEESTVIDASSKRLLAWYNTAESAFKFEQTSVKKVGINGNKQIYMLSYDVNGVATMIWAFGEKRKATFGDFYWITGDESVLWDYYSAYDGAKLDKSKIKQHSGSNWLKVARVALNFITPLNIIVNNSVPINYTAIFDKSTLANLLVEISQSEFSPWPKLYVDAAKTISVVLDGGQKVFVNPHTAQLTDSTMFPLFSLETGLPLLFHVDSGVILTPAVKGHDLQRYYPTNEGVLSGVSTLYQILSSGKSFYMGEVSTAYGVFYCPIFITLDSNDNQVETLVTGESANGIIRPIVADDLKQKESFAESIKNFFDGLFSKDSAFGDILRIVAIIGLVLLILILLPLLTPVFKLIILGITAFFKMILNFIKSLSKTKPKGR